MMGIRRVVITGMGVVSSIGDDLEQLWANLLVGECNSRRPAHFDSGRYRSQKCATIDYEAALRKGEIAEHEHRGLNICAKIGLIAARQALGNANLSDWRQYKNAGLSLGTTSGGNMDKLGEWFHYGATIQEHEILNSPVFMSMTNIAEALGLEGPVCNVSSACTSGSVSIAYAYEAIRNDQTDIMLAGGCDVMQEVTFAGFNSLRVVSPDHCRPFSSERNGMIIGDGAAIMVLEEYERAVRRPVRILGEIKGVGLSCDAYHATAPNAVGAAAAMKKSLQDANLKPADVQYINCHGTGTMMNDRAEAEAIRTVFGNEVTNLYATSTKSVLGHLLGTAGSIEAIVTLLVLNNGTIPPMKHIGPVDEAVGFKVVRNEPMGIEIENAMSNSFGFGGNNASLLFARSPLIP